MRSDYCALPLRLGFSACGRREACAPDLFTVAKKGLATTEQGDALPRSSSLGDDKAQSLVQSRFARHHCHVHGVNYLPSHGDWEELGSADRAKDRSAQLRKHQNDTVKIKDRREDLDTRRDSSAPFPGVSGGMS